MRLLAITPPCSAASRLDGGVVEAWIRGGALELGLAVLLREPGAGLVATLADPRYDELRAALAEAGIPALVSVDPRELGGGAAERILAARPALAGLQLRGDPGAATLQAWRAALPKLVLGRSSHGARPEPEPDPSPAADYTCLAPVFSPNTAQLGVDKRAIGLAALRRWTAAVPRVFALGGVTVDNAEACLAAGATGIAGISLFFGHTDVAQQTVAALGRVFARREAGPRPDDHVPQARQRR